MRRLTVIIRGLPHSKGALPRRVSLPFNAGLFFKFSGSSKSSDQVEMKAEIKEKNEMKDEYGDMDCSGETYIAKDFKLESGDVLPEAHVRIMRSLSSLFD